MDFESMGNELDTHGVACLPHLLSSDECASIAAMYDDEQRFRSRIVMAQHGFGRGEYKYFAYPLPATIARLRAEVYPPLAAVANRWDEALGGETRFPSDHAAFIAQCTRPARRDRRRSSSPTRPAISTACTRTSTG